MHFIRQPFPKSLPLSIQKYVSYSRQQKYLLKISYNIYITINAVDTMNNKGVDVDVKIKLAINACNDQITR